MVSPHTNGCPEPEVLAAYVDRGLSLSERARVDAHLASCPQCIALVAGVARTVEELSVLRPNVAVTAEAPPLITRRSVAGALAAAAAVIAVLATPALVRPWLERDPGLVSLVESVGEQRSVLGRLTGGFPHAPLGAPSAGGQDGRPAGTDRVQLAAGRIRESFGERKTPSQLHAIGVTQLLAGQYDDAALSLLAASREQPANAQYLSDVAAVQIERARLGLRPDDLPRALAAADRACRLDPSLKEAWFNRALAASALSLTAEAKNAWTEYLKRDNTSPWAGEARKRLDELAKPSRAAGWTSMEGRLQSAFDASTADEAVRTQATESRNLIENDLLTKWADAVIDGESGNAELDRVRTMAQAMRRVAGDSLYADAVAAIERASGSGRIALARAHKAYAAAAAVFVDDRFAAAAPGLTSARQAFETARSPFASRAALDLGAVAYFTGRADESAATLESLGAVARAAGYANISARVSWQQGLAAMGQGRLADAQNGFEDTLAAFERMNDIEQVAVAHNLLASLYYYLGDTTNEWNHRSQALRGLSISRNPRVKYGLIGTAAASVRAQYPAAALIMHDAAVAAAHEWGRSAAVAEALAQRASASLALGRNTEASRDLAEARHELQAVPDAQFRNRIEVAILSTESDLLRATDPRAAASAANKAIEIVKQRRDRLRLAQLNLRLAKANIAWGRLDEAQVALSDGIRAFDDERSSLTDEGRISTLDESWQLFESAVHLAIKNKDLPRAFGLAERARARTLVEARRVPGDFSLHTVEASLRPDQAVIALNQFEDELAIWVIRRTGTSVVLRPMSRQDAASFVARQQQEIRAASDTLVASASLYNEILRPVAAQLKGVSRVAVVSDGPLQDASFAAMFDKNSNRFFVENVSLVMSPSVFSFAEAGHRAASSSGTGNPLVLDGPRRETLNAREIAALYAAPEVLTGSLATRDRFLKSAVGRRVVHLSAATTPNSAYPLLSRVMLADEPGRPHSGALLGRDIAATPLTDTELVVIDQRAPATHAESSGLGLSRAFIAAGVPAVLTTLPGADETATRELFVGFHREVANGAAAVDALSRVQRHVIKQNGRRVGAWSALVIYGSDR